MLFIGSVQFIIAMLIAEAIYPGYNVSRNYISDLGVGPAAGIFNSSVSLLGLTGILAAYFVQLRVSKTNCHSAFRDSRRWRARGRGLPGNGGTDPSNSFPSDFPLRRTLRDRSLPPGETTSQLSLDRARSVLTGSSLSLRDWHLPRAGTRGNGANGRIPNTTLGCGFRNPAHGELP